jgi:purine-nucleoside phosphorylase
MTHSHAIVLPVSNSRTPKLGPVAAIVATQEDLKRLQGRMALPDSRRLYLSRLYYDKGLQNSPCVIGPVLGAPVAVMLLETLRVWGVQQIIFIGWCGSIQKDLQIGDVLLPDAALIDEGTSLHYGQKHGAKVLPDSDLNGNIADMLTSEGVAFRQGSIWTTDGVFRETPSKIQAFQQKGALAVEMEFSALLSASRFYGLETAGLMAVSDELFTGQWHPGFNAPNFILSRERITETVAAILQKRRGCLESNR